MSSRTTLAERMMDARIKQEKEDGMSRLGWYKGGTLKPWGEDVAIRTPRGRTIFKHPKRDDIYDSAREALYFGRLGFWNEPLAFDGQLDLMRDVMTLVDSSTPLAAIAAKAFHGDTVLMDHYLATLNREFLATPDEDGNTWHLSAEGKAVLLMLKQASATPSRDQQVPGLEPEQPKQSRRRRVMMG